MMYHGFSMNEAKEEMNRHRFGGAIRHDIPWMRKLAQECKKAAEELLSLPRYRKLNQLYGDRRCPVVSRLVALLSFRERRNLDMMEDAVNVVGSSALMLAFDGAVFSSASNLQSFQIADALRRTSIKAKIGIAIKPWPNAPPLPAFPEIPAAFVSLNRHSGLAPLPADGRKNVCLFTAVRRLRPSHPQSIAPGNGPFAARDFNNQIFSFKVVGYRSRS